MDVSIFFARFLGAFYLIFGLLFVVTKYLGKLIEKTNDKWFTVATGYNTLLLGLATVVLHNIWVWDWRVVITLIGWSTLIKGVMKIGFPEVINKQAQVFKNKQTLSTVIMAALGAWLIWVSL
ncbi:MAG: hypothetical protein JW791_02490 [Nanoarchaeota archaeon]|nr:hypothetical protein [Nanoarchaeota archaeon]